MSGFTPGPWAVGGDDGLICVTPPNTSEAVICDLQPRDADTFTDEDEANARLIAAAPELLEALRGLLDAATEARWPLTAEQMVPMNQARAALALAGEK